MTWCFSTPSAGAKNRSTRTVPRGGASCSEMPINATARDRANTQSLLCKKPTGRPAGQPVNDEALPSRAGLFLVDHHLQLLAGAKRGGDRRLDLNHATRLGIATHARRALAGFEVAEAGDLHLGALLELGGDDALVVAQRSEERR